MRKLFEMAGLQLLACTTLLAQNPLTAEVAEPGAVYWQQGVTTPELLPGELTLSSPANCTVASGLVQVNAVVGEDGRVGHAKITHAASEGLGKLALQVLDQERFTPGTLDGKAVAVAVNLGLGLEACIEVPPPAEQGAGLRFLLHKAPLVAVQLRFAPGEKSKQKEKLVKQAAASGDFIGVFFLKLVKPNYPFVAKMAKVRGESRVGFLVDTDGIPQYVTVLEPLTPETDQAAVEAAARDRFKPAIHAGKPIPFFMSMNMVFCP